MRSLKQKLYDTRSVSPGSSSSVISPSVSANNVINNLAGSGSHLATQLGKAAYTWHRDRKAVKLLQVLASAVTNTSAKNWMRRARGHRTT